MSMQEMPKNVTEKIPPTPTQRILGMTLGAFIMSLCGFIGLAATGLFLKLMYSIFMLGWNLI
jgi:glucose uptake protein GlcU